MKKISLLLIILLGLFVFTGCSSEDAIDTASDEVLEGGQAVPDTPEGEVEETLDDELLGDDNDVEIGELI